MVDKITLEPRYIIRSNGTEVCEVYDVANRVSHSTHLSYTLADAEVAKLQAVQEVRKLSIMQDAMHRALYVDDYDRVRPKPQVIPDAYGDW